MQTNVKGQRKMPNLDQQLGWVLGRQTFLQENTVAPFDLLVVKVHVSIVYKGQKSGGWVQIIRAFPALGIAP